MAKRRGLTRREAIGTAAGVLAIACDDGSTADDEGRDAARDAIASDPRDAAASDPRDAGGADDAADAGPLPDADGGPARPVVAAVRRADIDAAVARAVELAGGLDAIRPGQTVFIKPNAVHPANTAPAILTNFDVLGAVIRLVRARDPGRIVVGDRSARFFRSDAVFEQSGLGRAALDAGADEVYPAPSPRETPDAWVMVQPERYEEWWSGPGGVLALRRIVEADHLINVPTLKNHRWAGFSLSMKAFIGGVGDTTRDEMHYQAGDAEDLSRAIAILNQAFRPLMNVIDGVDALINGGPEGTGADALRAETRVILASRDRVALDALGVSWIQHELARVRVPRPDAMHALLTTTRAWSLPQIVHGVERGLGGPDAASVDLLFDGVDESADIEARFRA